MPDLRNAEGAPTGAIYGMVNMLRRLRQDYSAAYMACVFDAKGKTFRDDLYPEYKAHRPSMPEDLARQIEPIHEVVRALGWPILMVEGIEADDVIGTLAKKFASNECHVYIASGDKDFMQLVCPNISLIRLTNSGHQLCGHDEVVDKFGVEPSQVIDCLALMGDSSDMVPGVHGIGEKGAAKLIKSFGSVESLYENLDKLSPKLAQKLVADKDSAFMSKALVSIIQDLPIDLELDDLKLEAAPSIEKLIGLFEELEFNV